MANQPVTASLSELLGAWRRDLAAWTIPEHIASAAAESPWTLPRQVFARRADRQRRVPGGPSYERAFEALDPPGSVLDVGAGGGAACLPLAPRITSLTAVDTDQGMLDLLAERAAAMRLDARLVRGGWPEAAPGAGLADVVTCHHVLYNVPDLAPFLSALSSHARRRVVVEITAAHPLTPLNPLWLRFHRIQRPQGPTAADLLAIVAAMGLRPGHATWTRTAGADYRDLGELVDVTRRRLCLPPERAGEVEAALLEAGAGPGRPGGLGSSRRDVATIWWEGTA